MKDIHKSPPAVVRTRKPGFPAFYVLEGLIFIFFGVFFLYPLALTVKAGLQYEGHFSFYWLGRLFSNPIIVGQLANSILLAATTTLLVTLVAVPLSIFSAQFRFAGQNLLTSLLLIPLILPPFVGALSVKRFLGQFGILNMILNKLGLIDMSSRLPHDWLGSGFLVVSILQTLNLFPIMYLNLTANLANLDPSYMHAARNLGAGGFTTFRRIVLPLLRPGLFAGGSIVFIWSFTDIGTPLLLSYEELASVKIFKEIARADVSGRTYSLVLVMLLLAVLFYTIGKFFVGRSDSVESSKASIASTGKKAGPAATILIWACFLSIILLAVIPHIGVIITAFSDKWVKTILPEKYTFRHFLFVFSSPETRKCIFNSLIYASLSTLADLIIGSLAAWIIIRKRLVGSKILDLFLMLPLAVPGIILAAGYVAMTVKGSVFESIGPLYDPLLIIVIAYSVRRMPFAVRGISAGLVQIPETLEQAGRNLGAGFGAVIRKITIPLISANIIAASLLTFSLAMLEVSDSLVLAQLRQHYPITKEIFTQATSASLDANNIAACLGVLGMLVLGGSIGLAAMLLGKRLGAIFRA